MTALTLALAAGVLPAGDTYWQHDSATPGDWFVPANWTGGVPTSGNRAHINNGGTVEVPSGSAVADRVHLGDAAGEGGTCLLAGGDLLTDFVYVGTKGTGTVRQDSGRLAAISTYLGGGAGRAGGYGSYALSGSGRIELSDSLHVGVSGDGRFTQDGGLVTIGYNLILALEYGTEGVYELTSGEITAQGLQVGWGGRGTFVQSSGTVTARGTGGDFGLRLATSGGSEGRYELRGGALSAGKTRVGYRGTGEFLQTGGTHTVDTNMDIAGGSRYELSGGTHSVTEALRVGHGTYELRGPGQLLAGEERLGANGVGVIRQIGGTNTISGELVLGDHGTSGSAGRYELYDGTLSAGTTVAGYRSTGSFVQTGGLSRPGFLNVTDKGAYTLAAGTLEVLDSVELTGVLDFAGGSGTAVMTGLLNLHAGTITGGGNASLTITADSLVIFAAGYDPATQFGTFTNHGVTQYADGPVTLPAGRSVIGRGAIEQHFVCQGTLTAREGFNIDMPAGVTVAGGALDLGLGVLTIEDDSSGMSGGSLSVGDEHIGRTGSGRFVQTGGTHRLGRDGYTHGVLIVGDGPGSSGTFELHGGSLLARREHIGYPGAGAVLHTGGRNEVLGTLVVSSGEGSSSTYELSGTGELRAAEEAVLGKAIFRQSGGTNIIASTDPFDGLFISGDEPVYEMSGGLLDVQHYLEVGSWYKGSFRQTGGSVVADRLMVTYHYNGRGSSYTLSAGDLTADEVWVGAGAPGSFIHTGGTHTVTRELNLSYWRDGRGTYRLSGAGHLVAENIVVGNFGQGWMIQTGGLCQVNGLLYAKKGMYELGGGRLETREEHLDAPFVQTGGEHIVSGALYVAHGVYGSSTYTLSGGTLSAGRELISPAGEGVFIQTGGSNTVSGDLRIAAPSGKRASYRLAGGSLAASDLIVGGGVGSHGRLEVTGTADITVSGRLRFGPEAEFTAVGGTTVHMTGSSLENESTRPDAMRGFNDLTLVFEGGPAVVDFLEVACRDYGPAPAGFEGNFALGGLVLGGADVGRVRLTDDYDNQTGREMLYVGTLRVGPGSELDLNNRMLYFRAGSVDPAAVIPGAQPIRLGGLRSIQSDELFGMFSATGGGFGLGEFTTDDTCDVVVDTLDWTRTHVNARGTFNASLRQDDSAAGTASGWFADGAFSLQEDLGHVLVTGTVSDLRLIEFAPGELWGEGLFTVTGGYLAGTFPQAEGNFFEMTVYCQRDIDDFSAGFRSISQFTLTPIPEPAFALLAAVGLPCLLRRSRRRRRKGRVAWRHRKGSP